MNEFGKKKSFGQITVLGEESKPKSLKLDKVARPLTSDEIRAKVKDENPGLFQYIENFGLDNWIEDGVFALDQFYRSGFSLAHLQKARDEHVCPVCYDAYCNWPDSFAAYAMGWGGRRITRRAR